MILRGTYKPCDIEHHIKKHIKHMISSTTCKPCDMLPIKPCDIEGSHKADHINHMIPKNHL